MSGPLDPLSERGTRMVDALSPWEQEDPATVAIMRASADELDAIEELASTVRDQAWPSRADDTYGLLAIHEGMLSLPVSPEGVTLDERQQLVKAAVQSRKVGSRRNWITRMSAAMRGHQWDYQENFPDPGELTIRIPFAEGGYSAAQVQALAERITPAHVQIIIAFTGGFRVGVSRVGMDAI